MRLSSTGPGDDGENGAFAVRFGLVHPAFGRRRGATRMSLWNKDKPAEPEHVVRTEPAQQDGKELPGIAGYTGIEPLPKNGMPVIRFHFVRPDGKPE
jgi:hypothetical protein